MLHLKHGQKDKGTGPRIAFRLDDGLGLVISEDPVDKTITHVMIHGVNYTVDSSFDDTAAELGVELVPEPTATATQAAGGASA